MAASKHVRMLTHFRNAVPLVWGSLRLAPINSYVQRTKASGDGKITEFWRQTLQVQLFNTYD